MLTIGNVRADQEIALIQIDRDNAGLARIREFGERRLLDRPLGGGHKDEVLLVELLHRQDHVDLLARRQREHIDDRATARVTAALWHLPHLQPIQTAAVREAEDVIVCVGDE